MLISGMCLFSLLYQLYIVIYMFAICSYKRKFCSYTCAPRTGFQWMYPDEYIMNSTAWK